MKEILAGDSFFVVLEFNAGYDIENNLNDAKVFLGNNLMGSISLGGLEEGATTQELEVEIETTDTEDLSGNYPLKVELTDSVLGVQVLPLYTVAVLRSADVGQAEDNRLNDVRFKIKMYGSYVVSEVVLLAPVRTLSNYEQAVLNGYTGTEAEYNASYAQRVAAIQIVNKKDGDILSHKLGGKVVITGFVPNGETKAKSGFEAEYVNIKDFVLRTKMPPSLINQTFTGTVLIEKFID
ncbi:hypothetical protein [Jiulongibacter sp. NS-SX5]|uniref:hypothetical protein n=1 Tax=Jiulongibacter sp. NS-SX5 TaxID=3463854 RepID=UPI004057E7AF